MDNIDLEIKNDALIEIATLAVLRKTGDRGLRSIMEDLLVDLMYETPDQKDLKKVYEKILYDEVRQIILKEKFVISFFKFLKFPNSLRKFKLFLLLFLPKKIFLLLKKFNYL